ncbi:hypothetical protein [aff. Roholtiella sp. LEGE 12411]|uniref:hypothetical protein n=1 Tax=aff. Roholtiella sp. LEGE 12411 TaxID=1828822 RepID=UPI001FC8B978|nr:hypothetical protein [aff. Roholtiella sp. LEGE 12411]
MTAFLPPSHTQKKNKVKEQVMSEQSKGKVYLVTGVRVALDSEDGILIAGILSESPFTNNDDQESGSSVHPLGNFAFTRRQAVFLRDRLNEFLKDEG